MIGDKWIIYWNDYMSDAFSYGTKATFHALDDVEISNCLVPSGVVLKRWYSKTNYQMQGIEPTLPIIDGEATYLISVDMEISQEEGIFVELTFFDKYEAEVGRCLIRDGKKTFRCPLSTYSYIISLVSAGADSFRFHSFTIQEVADESEKQIKKNKKRIWKSKKIQKKHGKAE